MTKEVVGQARLIALTFGVLAACGFAAAQQGYAIQAGAYPTAPEAAAALVRLSAECTPVRVHTAEDGTGYPFKITVGHFSTYPEAYAAREMLNSPSLAGAFIVPDRDQATSSLVRMPARALVETAGMDQADPADAASYWEAAGLSVEKEDTLSSAISEELESALAADPAGRGANRNRLVLARRLARQKNTSRTAALLAQVRATGNRPERVMAEFVAAHADLLAERRGEALERFRQLAGDVSLPPGLRRECLRRMAGIFHSRHHYPEAWTAFEHLALSGATGAERQEARVQQAGLAFELVLRGKGNWDEVRALCQVVTEDPESPHRIRATAELMELETYWLEHRTTEALARAESFRLRYADVKREALVADLWRGLFLFELNRPEEARAIFEQVAEQGRGTSEKFAAVEPRARAAIWLAYIAHRRGDLQQRDYWTGVIRNEFPASAQAQRLSSLPAGSSR